MGLNEWLWSAEGEGGGKESSLVPSSGTLWTWLTWALAVAAQILRDLTSFTCTFFCCFRSQNINLVCKKETILLRLPGDVPTGSFAWGGWQGPSAFGLSPELKAGWVRAEQEGAAADESKKATSESFCHWWWLHWQNWICHSELASFPFFFFFFLSIELIVITSPKKKKAAGKKSWLPCPALSKALIAMPWFSEVSCY